MKHLMKFNESSFKSLYDTCLVELYDDGFRLSSVAQKATLEFKLEKSFNIKSLNYDRRKWIGEHMKTMTGRFYKYTKNNTIKSSNPFFSVDNLLPYQIELLNNIGDSCNKLLHTFNCKSGIYELETLYANNYNDVFINDDIRIYYKLSIILNT